MTLDFAEDSLGPGTCPARRRKPRDILRPFFLEGDHTFQWMDLGMESLWVCGSPENEAPHSH